MLDSYIHIEDTSAAQLLEGVSIGRLGAGSEMTRRIDMMPTRPGDKAIDISIEVLPVSHEQADRVSEQEMIDHAALEVLTLEESVQVAVYEPFVLSATSVVHGDAEWTDGRVERDCTVSCEVTPSALRRVGVEKVEVVGAVSRLYGMIWVGSLS